MSKYTLVGIFNFLFGIAMIFISLGMGLLTMPKLIPLYSGAGMDTTPILFRSYFFLIILVLLGISNLFFGFKLFSSSNKEKYFKFGIIFAVVGFLFSGILMGLMMISVLLPVYQLTTTLK